VILPSVQARQRGLIAFTILGGLVSLLVYLQIDPVSVLAQLPHLQTLAREMFPPRLAILWEREALLGSIVETLAMAFAGTLLGLSLALPAGLLGAANTTPHPAVRACARAALSLERAITSFFFLLVFLVTFGLGPFAGTMTLAIGTLGLFGKLFAESLERVEHAPVEAIAALGATRWQQIFFGVLPQATPALVANALFAFDVNLRLAISLGIFGAGGLGAEFLLAKHTLRYRDVFALALITLVLITTVERIADQLRKQL
jgi:phosphonate transport system permease protein